MKPTIYKYGALAVAGIIIIILLVRGGSQSSSQNAALVQACLSNGGTYDVSKQVCMPGSATGASQASNPNPVSTSHTTAPSSTTHGAISLANAVDVASSSDQIVVRNPIEYSQVASPLYVTGRALGSWYFEAVFPVYLTDLRGNIIAQGQARAQSDWQTNNFVPFQLTLTFPHERSGLNGFVVFKNANPSGSASSARSVMLPIIF